MAAFVSKVDPQKPELPLPDALPAQAAQTSPLPNPWWTLFNDARLNELIIEALKHNPDAQIAAARVMESAFVPAYQQCGSAADLERSRAMSLSSSRVWRHWPSRGWARFPASRLNQTVYTVQGTVAYELDLWGKYQRASGIGACAVVEL